MLSLTGKEKFLLDISSSVTSLHPLVVIEAGENGEEAIYLSQNEEVLIVNNVQTKFKSLNLNVPSIKESINIETKNLKTNTITISFSNYENFSDLFETTYLLNRACKVYWKSQSCTELSECLLVYTAYVKRVDHDKKTVKIILEDTTDKLFHRNIPSAKVPIANSPKDEKSDAVIPFSYGYVDKAPSILWEKEGDSDIYILSDDIKNITNSSRDISISNIASSWNDDNDDGGDCHGDGDDNDDDDYDDDRDGDDDDGDGDGKDD